MGISFIYLNTLKRIRANFILVKSQIPIEELQYLIVYCFCCQILKKAEKDLLFSKLSPHITNLIVGVFVKQLTLCSSDRKLETADYFDYTLGVEYGNGLSSIEKCTRIFVDGN